jgi:DNA polymerase-3 subunit epsilon
MREIIFDTETTGLDSREDRIIEIGAVELDNRFPTGRSYHVYINPDGRQIHPDAMAVHGISNDDLAGKPLFADIIEAFDSFIDGAKLVAHNASFDMGFINAERARIGQVPVPAEMVIDSLVLARRKHPMGPNSLDALCKRYGIDNSHRTKHGALLDAELLAEVYIEMLGGRQAAFSLDSAVAYQRDPVGNVRADVTVRQRPALLGSRLTEAERTAHGLAVGNLGPDCLWYESGLVERPVKSADA